MDCDGLQDDQWERLKEFVPGGQNGGHALTIGGF